MKKYIIGNWKSNKNVDEVQSWVSTVKAANLQLSSASLEVVLCPSFVYFPLLKSEFPELHLGAQTLSAFPNGAYTGAVSAQIASQFGKYAILGHAERRKYFAENDNTVTQQAVQALENGITPIIAVEAQNWASQLSQLDVEQLAKTLVMYEPREAISSQAGAHAVDLDEVLEAIQLIKSEFKVKGVLYGGSVNSKNIQTYLQESQIDGVVPGAASLDAQEFIQMVTVASSLKVS